MKSKGNPYVVGARRACPCKKNKAHFGKPIQLFKDSDKDGVANVFDCKPHNKRKQDVMAPFSGGSPIQEMYHRQEASRQQENYMKQLKVWEQQAKQDQQAAEAAQKKAIDEWNDSLKNGSGNWRESLGRQGKYVNAQGEIVPIPGWTPRTSGGMTSRSSTLNFAVTSKNTPKSKEGAWVGGKFREQKSIAQRVEAGEPQKFKVGGKTVTLVRIK